MELHQIYLELSAEHIGYVKFIFESYEEVGIVRTVDRKRAVIVILAMNDFLDTVQSIIASLEKEIPLRQIPRPADMTNDWLMAELVAEFPAR